MCLHVWSICRYIGSLSKKHSMCLRYPGRVFILCCSLICSGSEPFRPEEQLLSAEGEIFLVTNLANPLGNWYIYQLIWYSLVLGLLSESKLHLQLSSVRSAIWLSEFWFETFRSIQIWTISTLYALFYVNSSIFALIGSISNLISRSPCVLDLFREPHMFCWQGAMPPPESS